MVMTHDLRIVSKKPYAEMNEIQKDVLQKIGISECIFFSSNVLIRSGKCLTEPFTVGKLWNWKNFVSG